MTSLFSKLHPSLLKGLVLSWHRNDVIFGIMLMLGALAALTLAADGYAFYLSHLREPAAVAAGRGSAMLTEQEIDEVAQILNEREEKMKALLGGE